MTDKITPLSRARITGKMERCTTLADLRAYWQTLGVDVRNDADMIAIGKRLGEKLK